MSSPSFHDYNKYKQIPSIGDEIISYLIRNNETIWKLLKYPSHDALSKPNLSIQEKRDMIYKNQTQDSSKYRVFRQSFLDDGQNVEVSDLRIYVCYVEPTTYVNGRIDFYLDVLSHRKIIILEDSSNRNEIFMQQIIETLNGKDVGGNGLFYFDKKANYRNEVMLFQFGKYYEGYKIVMSVNIGG